MRRSEQKRAGAEPVIDPYFPHNGNFGYRVSRYELDLDYRMSSNRLNGTATITAVALASLKSFTLDLAATLTVSKVTVNGRRPAQFTTAGGKLRVRLDSPLPAGAAMSIVVRYGGTPRPIRSLWGDVGFEELSNGVLVAGQPDGSPSWFPCDDHPSAKASYRTRISTDSPYHVVGCGELVSRKSRAGQIDWVFEQAEPTSTYLATLQIGDYVTHPLGKTPVRMQAILPERLRKNFDLSFVRQPEMMKLFIKLFGPYPLAAGYTVVVTEDELDIPLEAQGISIFGANHCDGTHTNERLIAHEMAHQWFGNSVTVRRWRDIWLHEGFACYAEWLWSEHSGGPSADKLALQNHQRLALAAQDLLLADPGASEMFDDRVYKRGALTLHALRHVIGDARFFALLSDWTNRYRHSTVLTDDFTGMAANYADVSLRPLWDAWLYSTELPGL